MSVFSVSHLKDYLSFIKKNTKRLHDEVSVIQKNILTHSRHANSDHVIHTVYRYDLNEIDHDRFCVLVVQYLNKKNYKVKKIDSGVKNLFVLKISWLIR